MSVVISNKRFLEQGGDDDSCYSHRTNIKFEYDEDEDEVNQPYFQEEIPDTHQALHNTKGSDEAFARYLLQQKHLTASSSAISMFQHEEQLGQHSFSSLVMSSLSSAPTSAGTEEKRMDRNNKKSSYLKSSMNAPCGICFNDYFPYSFESNGASATSASSFTTRTEDSIASSSLPMNGAESNSPFASSNSSSSNQSTPTSSPLKQLSSSSSNSDGMKKKKNEKEIINNSNNNIPKSYSANDLQYYDHMIFESNEDIGKVGNDFSATKLQLHQEQKIRSTKASRNGLDIMKRNNEPPRVRRCPLPMNEITIDPTKDSESLTDSTTSQRHILKRPLNTNLSIRARNNLSTPPRHPNFDFSTPPRRANLFSSSSSSSFHLPSPSSLKFTPKSTKLKMERSKLEMLSSQSSPSSFTPTNSSSFGKNKYDGKDINIKNSISYCKSPLYHTKCTSTNKSSDHIITHNIQDLDEEVHLFDDDDCTVRVSNMQSTQYNKIHYGTPPRITTSKKSLQSNDDEITTATKEHQSFILSDEEVDANHVLHQLRKEWEVPPIVNQNSNSIFEVSLSSDEIKEKKKKKKNIIQKTSKKVKKILKRKKGMDKNGGGGSIVSDDAAIAGDASTQHQRSTSSLSSQNFADLWLKKIMDGEEILLNHSKENILLGTPLQIGVQNGSGKNGSSNRKTKKYSTSSSHSPMNMKKSNSFSFGTAKQIKSKQVGSVLVSKVGSPTRKIANMMTNLKHKRTLSNHSRTIQSQDSSSASPTRKKRGLHSTMPSRTQDDAIKGRLDGIDVISLGLCRCVSYIGSKDKSLAGQRYTLRSMVSDTLWASSGRTFPEIVLEGFAPNGNDRGTEIVEEDLSGDDVISIRQKLMKFNNKGKKQGHKSSERASDECEDDVTISKPISTSLLMTQIWGNESTSPPIHSLIFERIESGNGSRSDDGLLVVSSCPIDLERDIFLIKEFDDLHSAHSMAVLPLKYGKFDESIEGFTKILRSLEHKFQCVYGHHYLIGACHHNLGVLYMWSGNYEESLLHFNKAVGVRSRTLSFNHLSVAVSLSKVGLAYFALEQLDKALEAFENALNIQNKVSQPDSLEIAKLLNNIAAVHYHKGHSKVALKKLNEALDIMKKFLEGPIRRESIVYDTSVILSNIGKIHHERKQYDLAYQNFEEALVIQTSTFRSDHDCILACLSNLAYTRSMEGQPLKALQIYKSLFRIQINKFGKSSSEITETKGIMSLLYIQLGRYKQAHRCLKDVMTWQKRNLNQHHPALTNTKNTIDKLKEAIKGANESFAMV